MKKELGSLLGVPIFLLISTWGALATVVDMTEKLNAIRTFALGFDAKGIATEVPQSLRWEIFLRDWIPLWICTVAAVLVFAAIFFLVPRLLKSMRPLLSGEAAAWADALSQRAVGRLSHFEIACYGLSLLVLLAAVALTISGFFDYQLVEDRVRLRT